MINRAIKELKKTAYEPKIAIIGTRDYLCSNSKINKYRGSTLTSKCKQVRTSKDPEETCQAFHNTTSKTSPIPLTWQVQDIEDLHKSCSSTPLCPYYLQKLKVTSADIVFITYENMLDSKQLSNFNLSLTNSIVIFDEAHHIEKRCESISSFEIGVEELKRVVKEIDNLQKRMSKAIDNGKKEFVATTDDVENVKILTKNFINYLKDFDLNAEDKIPHSK
jgi:regulator of telomere elongation helicase 1